MLHPASLSAGTLPIKETSQVLAFVADFPFGTLWPGYVKRVINTASTYWFLSHFASCGIFSTNFARLYARIRSKSWSLEICEKIGPITGISRFPCHPVMFSSPDMILCTRASGNLPALRILMRLKSGVLILSHSGIGPIPLPSVPWQVVQ